MKLKSIARLGLVALCYLLSSSAFAQTTVNGRIVDQDNREPLIGASILVVGTGTGTVTDYDGYFELTADQPTPFTIEASYTGYESIQVEVTGSEEALLIELTEGGVTIETVEVRGQRISDKQKASPLTVESLDLLAIKQTASDNFYDGLGSLKGVDLTAASLGFKVINTRGFNSTSPVRSLQLIDGVDNQAPGLNFSLGNFLGSPELDVLKVDLIQGASSAFYGPNAFNGVISITSKNPFVQRGLSAQVKVGERNLAEGAFRYADRILNKDGKPFLAYKINFFALRADDWEARNFDPVDGTDTGRDNPGGWDAVNIYGDEFNPLNDFSDPINLQIETAGLGIFHRRGYVEEDLVDYGTRNIKANFGVHLRTNPDADFESPELIFATSFGTGTTVYQGDNRFSLRNIRFFQNRIEFRKQDKYFIRAYATHENAGDSYDPYFTALRLQELAKGDDPWQKDYTRYWQNNVYEDMVENGFPQPFVNNEFQLVFDRDEANQWLIDNADFLRQAHAAAQAFAGMRTQQATGSQDFFEPGTERFQMAFDDITSRKNTEGGTRFFDESALYHIQGEYNFSVDGLERVTVGGNGRLYAPKSEGTVFSDTTSTITNREFGVYAGVEKRFDRKWILSATARMDKNENFPVVFTPAASIVYSPDPVNYLRVSFSSALRNPTLSDQYLNLNVGRATLLGNLNGFEDLVTVESLQDFFNTFDLDQLDTFDVAPIVPERVRTFEVGYRTTLFDRLYVDAGYYYSWYDDFLGFNIGADVELSNTGFPERLDVFRVAANSTNQVTTQGFSIGTNLYFKQYYSLNANYSWNRLNKTLEDDPIIPAFNTPEHKYNIGISGRNVPLIPGSALLDNFGFRINYKWVQGFLFEGSPQFTGFIEDYGLLDAQINTEISRINTTLKIGASNVLNNLTFQTYGGPRIGRLAYVSVTYNFERK